MKSVVLIRRLTANPTSRAGEKHESATFRLAVARPGSDTADFVDIVTFDKLAATCGEWLSKGRGSRRGRQGAPQRMGYQGRRVPLRDPGRRRRRPVPRRSGEAGGRRPSDEKPADRRAIGAYGRKAS